MKSGAIEFTGAKYGLNTNDPAFVLLPGEVEALLNFKVLRTGSVQTRPPIIKYSNTSTSSTIKTFSKAVIGSTTYDLLIDDAYKIYYLDGSLDPTLIGTLEGDAEIVPFNAVAVIFDGSYIKYLDGVSSIKIAYDDGTGTSGYQFNHLTDTSDTFLALGNGTNTRIAQKFTSQAWTSGYTIPPTTFSVNLSANGTPNASVVSMVLRKVSDDSVLATKTLVADASALTTEDTYSATFTSSDITTEMSPSTAYYMSVEHTGGDASNYVKVHCNNCSTGGLAYHYSGSYTADTDKNVIAGLRPGMPPKGSWGLVHNNRIFAYDPDNPGWMRFTNASTVFDWSTASYAGYVGAIDSNANSFPVGGAVVLYEELYVIGTEASPYICKLSGATAADYELVKSGQIAWTSHRGVVATGNDIWFSNSEGSTSYTGVQEYGDLRTNLYSESVQNKFANWSTSTALSGYYPKDGQYFLTMPGYHRTLVCHIKNPTTNPGGIGIKYPWSEYEFVRDVFNGGAIDLATYYEGFEADGEAVEVDGEELYVLKYADIYPTYKWVENSGEYYLQAGDGGDPGIVDPDFVTLNGDVISEGTAGSLANHQWDYALDPSSTYYTIYFAASENPMSSGAIIKSILVPQCYHTNSGTIFIGSTDGFIYKIDQTDYKDLSEHQPTYDIRGRYSPSSDYITLVQQQVVIAGKEGANFNFSIYKNDELETAFKTTNFYLSVDDRLNIGDLVGDVADAYYLVDPEGQKTWNDIRATGYSFQFRVHDLYPSGTPVILRGWFFKYIQAE